MAGVNNVKNKSDMDRVNPGREEKDRFFYAEIERLEPINLELANIYIIETLV